MWRWLIPLEVTENIKNQQKHGIRFEDAIVVFNSPMFTQIDDRFDYGEVRVIGIGKNWTLDKEKKISVINTIIKKEKQVPLSRSP